VDKLKRKEGEVEKRSWKEEKNGKSSLKKRKRLINKIGLWVIFG
jgi:hypothetical protein